MYICQLQDCEYKVSQKDKEYYLVHVLTKHKKCPVCNKDLNKTDPYEHMENHGWKIRCDYCDKRFFDSRKLQKHYEKCQKTYNCSYKSRKYISQSPGKWIVKLNKLAINYD